MKCLIPVLAISIFLIQIHAIFIHSPSQVKKFQVDKPEFSYHPRFFEISNLNLRLDEINEEKEKEVKQSSIAFTKDNYSEEDEEEDCTELFIICFCKCGLAFFAGMLISDMKFIKFGVI